MSSVVRGLILYVLPAVGSRVLYQLAEGWGWDVPTRLTAAGVFAWSAWHGAGRCLRYFLGRQPPGLPPAASVIGRFVARLVLWQAVLLAGMATIYTRVVSLWGMDWAIAALAGSGTFLYFLGLALLVPPATYHRGRMLLSRREANLASRRARTARDPGLPWGGVWLPTSAAGGHFAVVGATGSGKTVTLRLLMQAVLPAIKPGSGLRAVVYDAKQDVVSLLAGMGVHAPVLLHPFDRRGVYWSVAEDCTSPATALQVAAILVPAEEGANRFFADAARDLLAGVLIALAQLAPGRWTLRDVLLAMKSPTSLRQLLARCPETRDRLHYFGEERTLLNVFATIATRMSPFEPIAAAWDRAPRGVSLADWVRGESVLVLGNDESVRTPLDAINRVIFQRLTELLLSQPETPACRTWVFLDEVREAAKLEGLGRLLTKGRSKGCAVVLGFQDIEGLREVYGERVANELVGQCGNKAILRLESPATADWASRLFGEQEVYERSRSESTGRQGGTSVSVAEQLVRRPAVLASEFLSLPRTGPTTGLSGYYLSAHIGAYRSSLPWHHLLPQLRPREAEVADFQPRPVEHQFLLPWDERDLARLGLPHGNLPGQNGGREATGGESAVWEQRRLRVLRELE